MKHNISPGDRIARIVIALAILALYLNDIIVGSMAYTLLAAGGILFLTSVINFCPIYLALGIKRWEKAPSVRG